MSDVFELTVDGGSSTAVDATISGFLNPFLPQSTFNRPVFVSNAYTLTLSDAGELLLASNGSTAATINIPTNASVAFPVGTEISIAQTGSGQITVQATSSGTTTVTSAGATAASPKLRAQYSALTCIKTGLDAWLVVGDIT